jgi:peptidoglycan/xylan/chitin deacetylase (PgdA/CDA1 family)
MVRWLDQVAGALDAAPGAVSLFFRDDDAGWRDDRLRALVERFEAHDVPLDVAAIPQALGRGIARELVGRGVAVHQHGLAHVNHEPDGRKHEFGPSRPRRLQRADIEAGRRLLGERMGDAVEPIFTPPWNRCTRVTGACLAELGFEVLSRESRAEPLGVPGLVELPVSADWCRLEPEAFAASIVVAIRSGGPVGVMLHHAEMDDDDVDRADALLSLVAAHERADALPMMAIVRGSRGP